MDKLQIFENAEFGSIRFMNVDGKPYAYASDMAKVLGYKNPQEAVRDHCLRVAKRSGVVNSGLGTLSEKKCIAKPFFFGEIIKRR